MSLTDEYRHDMTVIGDLDLRIGHMSWFMMKLDINIMVVSCYGMNDNKWSVLNAKLWWHQSKNKIKSINKKQAELHAYSMNNGWKE